MPTNYSSYRGGTTTITPFAKTYLDDSDAISTRTTLNARANIDTETSLASAGTCDLSSVASNNVFITGTTTITSLGSGASGMKKSVRFQGTLTLTHNASIVIPGGSNINTAANDSMEVLSMGAGVWYVLNYTRQASAPFSSAGYGYTVYAKGNSGTSTQTYDHSQGTVQTSTATGNHTIAFSNWPTSGKLGEMMVLLTNGGAYTITWPTINWIKPDGTETTSISTYLNELSGRASLRASGIDQFYFWTTNAGTTVYGKII